MEYLRMGSNPPHLIKPQNMAKRKTNEPMPFDSAEWLQRIQIRALSPEVRGLWVDLLCYMWESAERGVMVKPNLDPYSRKEIVNLIGSDSSGGGQWLDELVDSGLCSIRDDGAYFSRQIVRGEEIRAKRREAGKRGGNVTKAKVFSANIVADPPKVEETVQSEQMNLFPPEEVSPDSPPPLSTEQKAKAERAKKYKYAEFVTLKRDEYAKLCEEHGEDAVKIMINKLNNYKGQNRKRYKSDYYAINNWVVDSYYEDQQKYGTKNNRRAVQPSELSAESGYRDTLQLDG